MPLVLLVQSGVHGSTQPGTRQLNLQTSSSQVDSKIMEVTKSRKKKQEESKKRSGQWSTGAPLGRHAHFELKSLLTRSAVQRRYKNPFLSPEYIVYLHISSRGEHCTLRLYRRIIRSDFRERKSHLRYLHLHPPQSPHQSPLQ